MTIILWFLAVYLGVAVLTPMTLRAHDRWGLGLVALVISVIALIELTRFAGGSVEVAYVNYFLIWALIHQLGFAWEDGRIIGGHRPLVLGLVSAAVLVALVVWGPYPVSMVTVPGAEVQNTGPPSLALLALGFAQIGLVLALRPLILPHLQKSWLWTTVVAINAVIMSVFLWHVVPVILLTLILWGAGVTLPGPTGSLAWLAFRPVWVAALLLLLLPLILVLTRIERPPDWVEEISSGRQRSLLALAMGLAGMAATSAALARLTLEGFWAGTPTMVPVWGAITYLAGLLLIGGCGRLASPPQES